MMLKLSDCSVWALFYCDKILPGWVSTNVTVYSSYFFWVVDCFKPRQEQSCMLNAVARVFGVGWLGIIAEKC